VLDLLTALSSTKPASAEPADATGAIAREAVVTLSDAGILEALAGIASTSPSLAVLQASGDAVDDVRPHALSVVKAFVSTTDGCALLQKSQALTDKLIACLVTVVASFRSPDSSSRHKSVGLALQVSSAACCGVASF
jgi:hypothetical protein